MRRNFWLCVSRSAEGLSRSQCVQSDRSQRWLDSSLLIHNVIGFILVISRCGVVKLVLIRGVGGMAVCVCVCECEEGGGSQHLL